MKYQLDLRLSRGVIYLFIAYSKQSTNEILSLFCCSLFKIFLLASFLASFIFLKIYHSYEWDEPKHEGQ
jgi:hypothetical protein